MRKSMKRRIKAGFLIVGALDLVALYVGSARLEDPVAGGIQPESIADASLQPLTTPGLPLPQVAALDKSVTSAGQPAVAPSVLKVAQLEPGPAAAPAPVVALDAPLTPSAAHAATARTHAAWSPSIVRSTSHRPLFERTFPRAAELVSPDPMQQDIVRSPADSGAMGSVDVGSPGVGSPAVGLNDGELPALSAQAEPSPQIPFGQDVAVTQVPVPSSDAGATTAAAPGVSVNAPDAAGTDAATPAGAGGAAVLR
jgi:hypothetical protein